jgi:hypothetical protein
VANVDEIKDRVKNVVIEQIDSRSADLGNAVGGHVENLRSMGDSLRSQGQGEIAGLVDMAADRLDRVAAYLHDSDGDQMMRDLETLARTRPLITATAGLAIGFTAARLVKAGVPVLAQTIQTVKEDVGWAKTRTS